MNFNQPTEELIERYVRSEMSADEVSAFESKMQADPEFGRQVSFQQDITRGIGEYRKAQLKARLDMIQVSPSPLSFGTIGESMLYKVVGGVVIASIVGVGIYLYPFGYGEPPVAPVEINSEVSMEEATVPDMPQVVLEETENPATPSATAKSGSEPRKLVASVEEKVPADREEKEFSPVVNTPELEDVSDRSFSAEKVEMPEVVADFSVSKASEPIDVKTFEPASSDLRYKYFEGDLYLYGDFKKEPYEILEINSKSSKEIYLYHASLYYKIESTSEIRPLKAITNEGLVRDLTIIRTSKSE